MIDDTGLLQDGDGYGDTCDGYAGDNVGDSNYERGGDSTYDVRDGYGGYWWQERFGG